MNAHFLLDIFRCLRLKSDDSVIFGSGPLWIRGLRPSISDLDVVARGRAWTQALLQAGNETVPGKYCPNPTVRFWGGQIEVTSGWITPDWDIDALIDTADVIAGLRFATLTQVLRYKRILNRDKDQPDLRALTRRLGLAAGQPEPTAASATRTDPATLSEAPLCQ